MLRGCLLSKIVLRGLTTTQYTISPCPKFVWQTLRRKSRTIITNWPVTKEKKNLALKEFLETLIREVGSVLCSLFVGGPISSIVFFCV
jgi:hypothetical protein